MLFRLCDDVGHSYFFNLQTDHVAGKHFFQVFRKERFIRLIKFFY